MKELLHKALPAIPDDIFAQLNHPSMTQTSLEQLDSLLLQPALQAEAGYVQEACGDWQVSMYCPMPGITPEMIQWWFWWHPQDKLRYKVWYPGDHISNSYRKSDRAYFEQDAMPAFQPNTHYPTEKIGGVAIPLRIDFVTPEQFGFSRPVMDRQHIPLIVCGHVSALGGLIPHTEMAHIFRQTTDGLWMFSRFWIGKNLRNPLIRRQLLTEKTARAMAEHCCIEYRNLAEILPGLFAAHHQPRR